MLAHLLLLCIPIPAAVSDLIITFLFFNYLSVSEECSAASAGADTAFALLLLHFILKVSTIRMHLSMHINTLQD